MNEKKKENERRHMNKPRQKSSNIQETKMLVNERWRKKQGA